jgi:hypothetical protein
MPGFRSLYATQGSWLDGAKRRFPPFDRGFYMAGESFPAQMVARTGAGSELSPLFNRVYLSQGDDARNFVAEAKPL